jgi:glyceraldehyde-3-phosphate dehydrogenase (NADP+)
MSCENIYSVIKAESGIFKYYCNGQWLESSSGKSVPVINPSTQEKDYAVQGKLWRCVGTPQ